jgi:hypothetical protein
MDFVQMGRVRERSTGEDPNVTAIVVANNESVNASAIGRDLLALFYGERYTPPRAAD